uniref:Diguanylate cyclase/phosphodiesterase (GGDEF & EAL domains) with PAS/PAC sensor(S) n=1 Tax=uncultured Thiotrichaceae bacterium TaxID=298394 RepID=A0A6S6U6Q5_9GAMM|nr:MAG: diguanylate cyclase/phosphodiesterase (GGDEF & EAL domains) with PAS/PAC sensor(s) [uncultured Thiotrichaceae bacterium]
MVASLSFDLIAISPPIWYLVATVLFLLVLLVSFIFWRKRFGSQSQLFQQNALISALLDVNESAVLMSKTGHIEFINPAAERLFRCKVPNARGKFYSDLFHLTDPLVHSPVSWLEDGISGKPVVFRECSLNCSGVQELDVSYLVRSIDISQHGETPSTYYLLLIRDQAEISALRAQLAYVQTNDAQTKLLNRKSFEAKLKIALDETRQRGLRHAFCHVSLDQFKVVNDTLGHNAGDLFIERISDLLKESIDQNRDVLARIGGDEFGILFRESEPVAALRAADQVRVSLARLPFKWDGKTHKITASIGFVPMQNNTGTPNRLLSIADAACRVAKEKGGNRLYLYRPDDEEIRKHRGQLTWVGKLKKAFETGQFELYAQPIHPLESREFLKPHHHYEVLLRLFDSDGTPISPDEFIPAAEYYSMMPKLDRWVVTELFSKIKPLDKNKSLVFAVNLSGQSLDDPKFLSFVLDAIRRSGISPGMVCFEITERLAIHNLDLARKFIDTLKKLGCSFSLDDFGTGVSSFAYLKELPVDYLKIDGSFIKDIVTDDVGRAMVQSVNQVGKLMSLKIIAEYVENDEIIKVLRDMGIDYGQGYGIAKPMPITGIIDGHLKGSNKAR